MKILKKNLKPPKDIRRLKNDKNVLEKVKFSKNVKKTISVQILLEISKNNQKCTKLTKMS